MVGGGRVRGREREGEKREEGVGLERGLCGNIVCLLCGYATRMFICKMDLFVVGRVTQHGSGAEGVVGR